MKFKIDIAVRICALLLVALFFLPYVSVYNTMEKAFEKGNNKLGYSDYKADVETFTLFDYTFGNGEVDGEEYPEDYGVQFITFSLVVLAIVICITGTKFPLISAISALAHIIMNVVIKGIVQNKIMGIYANSTDKEVIADYLEKHTFNSQIGMVLQIIICILILAVCVVLQFNLLDKFIPKKKKTSSYNSDYSTDTYSSVTSESSIKCPVCGSALEDGEVFCGTCGTNVSTTMAEESVSNITDEIIFSETENPKFEIKADEVTDYSTTTTVNTSNACPNCGAPMDSTSIFCGACGFMTIAGTPAADEKKPSPVPPTITPSTVDSKPEEIVFRPKPDPVITETITTFKAESPKATPTTTGGLKSTMRTKPSESPEESAKKASGKAFFNKPTDL